MCRIHGSFHARTTDDEMRRVAALQHHGGPDAQSFARQSGWALGNNRLSIMDPEGGDQPYRLGDITVVFNGEIYNHDRLRTELMRQGFHFDDRCDGSILPALYLTYGDRFAEHLDGMFSVAVMDLRREPRLVIATDASGMKPLYYHWDERSDQFHFASELPALLGFDGVRPYEDELGLHTYLSAKTPFGQRTMFEGIDVLPPATTAVVTREDGLRLTSRRMGYESAPPVDEDRSLSRAGESLRELLSREVSRLLVADAPVAAITSGGLDSSLVTALAARILFDRGSSEALHTFNIAYTGNWPGDERAFASEVSRHTGTVHHQVEIDPATFPDLMGDVVRHLGQPNADPITLSTFSLFRAVRDAGFKVALTGDAADELFGGYSRMTQALAAPEGADWRAPTSTTWPRYPSPCAGSCTRPSTPPGSWRPARPRCRPDSPTSSPTARGSESSSASPASNSATGCPPTTSAASTTCRWPARWRPGSRSASPAWCVSRRPCPTSTARFPVSGSSAPCTGRPRGSCPPVS